MKQIHIDVNSQFWAHLYEATQAWPAGMRTQVGICRYALSELAHDLVTYPDEMKALAPAPTGDQHVQVRTLDPEDEKEWASMLGRFNGSYTLMLRVALEQLYRHIRTPA
jgi:hypothetical protein